MMIGKVTMKELLKVDNKNAFTITTEDMFQKVWQLIKKLPELKKVVKIIDYAISDGYKECVCSVVGTCNVFAVVNTGGSEGIYINYYLEKNDPEDTRVLWLGTIKTLEEDMDAYIKMGMLSGALTKIGELFLFYNF